MKIEYENEYTWTIRPERIVFTPQAALYYDSPLHLGPQGIGSHDTTIKILPDPVEDSLYMIIQGTAWYEVIRVKHVFHNNVCEVERGVLDTSPAPFPALSILYPIDVTTRIKRKLETDAGAEVTER